MRLLKSLIGRESTANVSSAAKGPPAVPSASPAPELATAPQPIAATSTRASPAEHPYQVLDFFAFRGALFARGIVEHASNDSPEFFFRLPDETRIPAVAQPDAVHASSANRTCFVLSAIPPALLSAEAVEGCSLIIQFRGRHLLIDKPAEQRLNGDRFFQLESMFWDLLKPLSQGRVLEIGSRARSQVTRRHFFPAHLDYVGLDIVAGPNVDVVGDAHELSKHFPAGHFDAAFTISVWEHLAMPWKVSLELNHVLKTGGVAIINSHQTWPSHEEPWDYFRFSEYAWAALFNRATGFEILGTGMGCPAVCPSALPIPYLQNQQLDLHYGYLASRCVIRKIAPTTLSWPVPLSDVTPKTYGY